jgi:hypothetical protein
MDALLLNVRMHKGKVFAFLRFMDAPNLNPLPAWTEKGKMVDEKEQTNSHAPSHQYRATPVNPNTYRQARRNNNRDIRVLAGATPTVKNMVFYAAGIKLLKIW